MRQKLFLFIIALCACAASIGAANCVDSIPAPVYMANIQFDPETDMLSFNDTFHPDKQLKRY